MLKEFEILELKLPCLEFLLFENIYSGSYDDFNFKIFPETFKCKFKILVWIGFNCLDKSKVLVFKEFNLDEKGHFQAQKWLLNEFEKFKKVIN